jgi:hypothetical protein
MTTRLSDQLADLSIRAEDALDAAEKEALLVSAGGDLIVASENEKQLESHRREITALFCDPRGFTGFTESADGITARLSRGHRRNHHQIQWHTRTIRW